MSTTEPLKNQLDANGMREGIWEEFYPGTERLLSRASYKAGRRSGLCECFSFEGFTTLRAEFENGLFHGTVEFFDDGGNLINRSKQEHGVYVEDPTNFIAVTGDKPHAPKP